MDLQRNYYASEDDMTRDVNYSELRLINTSTLKQSCVCMYDCGWIYVHVSFVGACVGVHLNALMCWSMQVSFRQNVQYARKPFLCWPELLVATRIRDKEKIFSKNIQYRSIQCRHKILVQQFASFFLIRDDGGRYRSRTNDEWCI